MKFLSALLLCAALPLSAQEFSVYVIDRNDDVSALPSACIPGSTLRWRQNSIVDRAEIGAYIYVSGMVDARYNGLYRITEYSKTRDADANYRVTFTAQCVTR